MSTMEPDEGARPDDDHQADAPRWEEGPPDEQSDAPRWEGAEPPPGDGMADDPGQNLESEGP
jgi:hypothetical protein